MNFFKQKYRIILMCSVIPAAIMLYVSSVFFSSKYELSAVVNVYQPSSVFVPKSMQSSADREFSAVTADQLIKLLKDPEVQQEVGLKLLATHLTLRNADPEIISVKQFNALHESVPSDILKMAGETDSITFLNLLSAADTHPFLIETIRQSDVPYYSKAAISSVSANRIGVSDMVTLHSMSDDPATGRKTLEIILDICRRRLENQNTANINKIIAYCENRFQEAQNELRASGENLRKLPAQIRIRTVQQRENLLKQLHAEREEKMAQRERILNHLMIERGKISTSESSMKTIENQINMQNLTVTNRSIAEKVKTLTDGYHLAEIDSVSFRAGIRQAELDLKNEITAVVMPLQGNEATKKKVIEEYYQALITLQRSRVRAAALEEQRLALYRSETLTSGELAEIEAGDQNYLHALDELNKAKRFQQSLRGVSPIQIIEKPDAQEVSRYKSLMWTLLAGSAGFVFSFVLIALHSVFSRKLKTPPRTEQKTGLKVAGIVPNDKKIESYSNSHQIRNILMYYMLWNFFQKDQKQRRVLVTSIYPGDGKTFVCDMLSDWLMTKGLKCKVVTPFFEDGVWWVKSHNVVGVRLDPVDSFTEIDVMIMKLSPLVTGDYPIELIRNFHSTFLVCKSNREWKSFEKKVLDNYMSHSKHVPQVILNNVEMDVVKNMLGKINLVKTFHASEKRSSQRVIARRHKTIGNKEEAQQIVKAMPNLGVILDKNRQVVYANDAITSLLGLGTMGKALGMRPGELVSCVYSDMTEAGCGTSRSCRNCGAVNTILKCINSRQHEVGECRIHSFMNGEIVPFEFKISCAPLEVNDEFFVVTNLADIKGEEEKRKDLLTKTVLDAKINGDVSVLNRLVDRLDETGQLDRLLDTFSQTNAPIAEELIEYRRLVDARNGVLQVQFDYAGAFAVLDSVVRSVREQAVAQDKKISLAPPFPEVSFLTDTAILEQILRTMLINAVKSVPEGGIVYAGYEKTKHAISFYVFNEGVIPEHLQADMFRRQEDAIENEKDFGMYGIKLLGECLNGIVGFKSAKETGTRFYITIRL